MRIDAIRLQNVRRFGTEGISLEGFEPGLNILSQPNEWGKSTVLEALRTAVLRKATGKPERDALLPVSSEDNPLIEVDLTLGDQSWRVRKVLAGAKAASKTEIVDQRTGASMALGSDAEKLLLDQIAAEEKKGRSLQQEGHAGLVWLRQGSVLQSSLSAEERSSLQTLLAGEVGEVTGDTETQRVLDAAAAELEKLETKAKGNPTGDLKAIIDQVTAQRQELADAQAKVAHTAALRQELASDQTRLQALDDPASRALQQQQLTEAKTKLDKAQNGAAALGHTAEAFKRIDGELGRLKADRESFEGKLNALKELDERGSKAAEKEVEHQEAEGRARVVVADKTELVEAARATLKERQAEAKLVRAKERWDRDRDRLSELREHLASAEAILREIEGCQADAEREPVNVDRIQKLERQRDQVEAALRAAAPDIEVVTGGDVAVDGAPLLPGERRPLAGEGLIKVGATELRIHTAGQAADRQKRADIQREIERFESETGFADYASALAAETARREAQRSQQERWERLKIHAPHGVDRLRTDIKSLAANEPVELSADLPEPEEAERLLAEAESADAEADAARRAAENDLRRLENQGRELRQEHESRARDRTRLLNEVGSLETHAAKLAEFDDQTTAKERELAALTLKQQEQEEQAQAAENLRREIEALEARAKGEEQNRQNLRINIARMETELRQLFAEDVERHAAALAEELDDAERELARLERRRAALRLLVESLRQEQLERRENFVRPLQAVLEPMLRHVFGESRIRFGSELTAEALERGGAPLALEKLSLGAQEQVAVLVRLALAQLLADRGEPVPLILDDALTYADDERLRRVFDLIRQTAERTQVIVLTCHDRMFAALGGNLLLPAPFEASR